MLQDSVERIFVENLYADIERGLFLVRGENVVLLGEIVSLYHWCESKNSGCWLLVTDYSVVYAGS